MQTYLTEVTEIKYLTLDILELHVRLIPPDVIEFQAGQFMQFEIGDKHRAYSIVSTPTGHDTFLVFCIKLIPNGIGSEFVKQLQKGSQISMRGPLGQFVIHEDDYDRDIALVATGVGVAPFRSMVNYALAQGYPRSLHLLFGVRNEENIFYFDPLQSLAYDHKNFQFIPLLSQPQSHWPGQVGRVTTYIDAGYDQFKDRLVYLCGSKDMVTDARKVLLDHGHNVRDIRLEIFT